MIHTHQTAPTQFVEANGIRFAYRRFGNAAGVPLVFNQHFTGTMDHWDPPVTDGFANDREVILFNNAGVSSSSGEIPTAFEKTGANAVVFIKALRLTKVDVLGFSIGGFIAQEIALQAPRSRQAPRIGRRRPARWGEHGYAHARGAGNLRYHL
jgi:pimeloyl-ACP methyl ester carboxylesterase